MDRQLGLFGGEKGPSPVHRGPRPRVRRHRPGAGELGVALVSPQAEIVDGILEILEEEEAMRGHALPVRVEDVLFLPRDLDVVGALIDLLDEGLAGRAEEQLPGSAERERLVAWRRPADRLAQKIHEWWLDGE